jgi:hypothetical protein
MNFKSQQEIYQALLEGKTLENSSGNTVFLNEYGNQAVMNSYGVACPTSFKFDDPEEWTIRTKVISIGLNKFKELFKEQFDFDKDCNRKLECILTAINNTGAIK